MTLGQNHKFILDRAVRVLNGTIAFNDCSLAIAGHSERIVEVPWAAQALADANRVLDIGFAMSSLDWLGLLLASQSQNNTALQAVDIVRPQRVASRYPDHWQQQVLDVDVTIGDIRNCALPVEHFDLVTCISTLEHIGFDIASVGDPDSAFQRGKSPAQIATDRDKNVNRDVLAAFHRVLQPGGTAMISVPMGKGGPTLLKDSLGLYTRQWEYEANSWNQLISQPGFNMREQRFFGLGDDDFWHEVDGPQQLKDKSSELQPHASGCALVLLEKQ